MMEKRTYLTGVDGGAEVVLIEVTGGGHMWPRREPPLESFGPSTRDISAIDLMWSLFERHARKQTVAPSRQLRHR